MPVNSTIFFGQIVGDFSGNLGIWLVSILNFVQHETGSQK